MDQREWYALRVKSRCEKSVNLILKVRDYESFLPTYRARHKWADRYKTVELPLFPGYIFCRAVLAELPAIVGSPGIVDVIRQGMIPAVVHEQEIAALERVQISRLNAEPWPELTAGESIIVVDGPLKGISGSLLEIKNTWRLLISVSLLQRSVIVEIDRDWVVPVRRPHRSEQATSCTASRYMTA